ncbi:MAG: S1 RNA-binding domain-containing protein [Chloroflexales bacterium]|nr:S1 RNA-binding domain-containing protein [Chloroflexales bacterium]
MASSTKSESYLTVQIQRLLPFGMLVHLDDGRTGIIREREIAWDRDERRHWREYYKPGDTIPAVVLGERHNQRLELSLRLAQNDPWLDLPQRYRLGQIVTGMVTGIQPYGVFVEIEAGVVGLLHHSRLPPWTQPQSTEDLFWLGDRIKVVIELIDPARRRLGLNLTRTLSERWIRLDTQLEDAALTPITPVPIEEWEVAPPSETLQPSLELIARQHAPWTILVVEDDPAQCEAVAKWLRQAGQRSLSAGSAEEGLALIEQERPTLILMDLGLPGMNGIAAIQQIHVRWPGIHCVLMTDWARADEHMVDLEALQRDGIRLLIKPLLPEDLSGVLLDRLEDGGGLATGASRIDLPLANNPHLSPITRDPRLTDLLLQLRARTHATKVVLFALDPAQGNVQVVAEAGARPLNLEALLDLIYSPVRNVAVERWIVRIADARLVEARIRYLRPLLSFQSCLGVPLPGDLPEDYALFVFFAQLHAVQDIHEQHAFATALAASALLERQRFQIRAAEIQRLALLGQLSRALVHELNHQLSPINFALTDLQQQCTQVNQLFHDDIQALERHIHEAHETLGNLATGVRRLTETARLFGRVTIQSREQVLDPAVIIGEAVHLARDMADRAHVTMVVVPSPIDVPLRMQAAQFQQIVLNVVINAIQQIALLRPSEGGRVQISMEQTQQETHTILRITVEDDGPGIHYHLWERIFELGFTTRRDGGSGLGLYVTRSLVESLGGRAFVAQSHMLWGTTMVVEVPLTT